MSSPLRSPRRRTAQLCGPFAAALALGALAASPASATVSPTNPPEAGENVTVFHNIDFVAAFGVGAVGNVVNIEVLRNNVVIGSTSGPLVDLDGVAGLEANHGPAGAPVAGDCWNGPDPDIRPGDVVRVTNTVGGNIDEVTVDQIEFDGDAELQPNGDVTQKGIARFADGSPIPIAALDSNGFLDTSKFRGPAHQVLRTPGTTDGFTNVFNPPYDMERNQIYPTIEERLNSLLNAGGHEAGFGHVDPLPLESMLLDGNADDPTSAPGCPTDAQGNRVTGTSADAINATTGDLTVSGIKMGAASDVNVTLSDGTTTTAPVAANATGNTWTATFTAADRAALADGPITIAGAYNHGGTALTGKTMEIQKDVVAPTLAASPGAGTYTGPLSVALTAGAGEQIRYRLDGGTPTASDSLYGGPIALPFGTTTIGVRVSDAAGNVIQRTLTYTVNRPPAAATPGAAASSQLVIQQQSANTARSAARLRATARANVRRSLRAVRRNGLSIAFTAPAGTQVAEAKLYRLSGSERRLVSTRNLRVRAGRRSVRFSGRRLRAGKYVVQLRVGAAASSLGSPVTINVTVIR